MSVDPKTWFSCNRRDHPDAKRVLGDRNRPDRTSMRGRTLKGKGAVEFRYEETWWARASIMFSRASIAWTVPIVPATPASECSSPPPRLKIDTIATTRKIFSGQTSHNLHLPFSQSLVLFAVSGWDSLCSVFEVLGYRPEAYWLPPKTRNLKVKNVNLLWKEVVKHCLICPVKMNPDIVWTAYFLKRLGLRSTRNQWIRSPKHHVFETAI